MADSWPDPGSPGRGSHRRGPGGWPDTRDKTAISDGTSPQDLDLGDHLNDVHGAARTGRPDSVHQLARNHQRWSEVLNDVEDVFRELDLREWRGKAAELCEEVRSTVVRRLANAGEDLGTDATALDHYARTLDDARQKVLALEVANHTRAQAARREAPPPELMARWLSGLDQAAEKTARTIRDQARTAPRSSAFSDTPELIGPHRAAHPTGDSPTRHTTAHHHSSPAGPLPPTGLSPSTSAAAVESSSAAPGDRVWTYLRDTGIYTGDAPTPGLVLPAAADQWPPDDPRRKRFIEVQLPQAGQHDNLSWITARYLHDASLWPVVYHLNMGLPQPDGGSLQDPNLIRPGWLLALPDDLGTPSGGPVTPFGHNDHSCLPPPGPHDDPAVPARTGPPEHTITPVEGMLIGTGTALVVTTVAVVAGRRGRRRANRDPRHPPDHDQDPQQGPTVRAIHVSLAQAAPDAFYAPPGTTVTESHDPNSAPPSAGPRRLVGGPPPHRPTPPPRTSGAISGEWTPLRTATTEVEGNTAPAGQAHVERRSHPLGSGPDHAMAGRTDTETTLGSASTHPPGTQPAGTAVRVAHPGLARGIGVRDGHAIVVDLAALRGLGLHGEGALAAARFLLVDLCLPPTLERPTPAARIYIPKGDLASLLDDPDDEYDTSDPNSQPTESSIGAVPESLRATPDLATALSELELEILRRSRQQAEAYAHPGGTSTSDWEPIVLIARMPAAPAEHPATDIDDQAASQERRLRSVLSLGATLGIAGILIGPWRGGTCCHLDRTGRVTSTAGPAGIGPALNNTQIHAVPSSAAREVMGLLRHTQPHPAPPEHSPATASGLDEDPLTQPITPAVGQEHSPPDAAHAGQEPATTSTALPAADDTDTERLPVPTPGQEPTSASPPTAGDIAQALTPGSGDHATSTPDQAATAQPDGTPEQAFSSPRPAGTPEQPRLSRPTPAPAPPPGALLMILALGRLEVYARTTPGAPWTRATNKLSRLQRVMLGALAAHTDPIPTERLLDMCWPDTRLDQAAMKTMHSFIYRLRTRLNLITGGASAEFLVLDSNGYHLNSPLCWIDHYALHAHLPPLQISTDAELTTLHTVFDHYQGTLLHHLEYEADVRWLDSPRIAARDTAVRTAHQLADHVIHTDPDQAASYLARVLTSVDRTSQITARRLINLHCDHNRPDEAKHVYDQLKRDLKEQADVAPEPATVQLIQRRIEHPQQAGPPAT